MDQMIQNKTKIPNYLQYKYRQQQKVKQTQPQLKKKDEEKNSRKIKMYDIANIQRCFMNLWDVI